jgi:hypothetical protein
MTLRTSSKILHDQNWAAYLGLTMAEKPLLVNIHAGQSHIAMAQSMLLGQALSKSESGSQWYGIGT